MKKSTFYFLSLTWGLLMTLIGAIAVGVLMLTGKPLKKWGACYYVEVGKGWGGVNLGMFLITSENPSRYVKSHEHGHAIQNCYWGVLMPIVIGIPSVIRYWYRAIRSRLGAANPASYDSIWFEGQATRLGRKYVTEWEDTL